MSEDKTDIDFASLMQESGVRSYEPGAAGASQRAKSATGKAPQAKPVPAPKPASATPATPAPPHPLQAEVDSLRTERDGLRRELSEIQAKLASLEGELKTVQSERDGVDGRRREVEETCADLRLQLDEVTRSTELREILKEGGCRDDGEVVTALNALLAAQPEQLLEGLVLASSAGVGQLLQERLAFLCESESCQPDGPCAVVRVSPERCEVCGGSDLRRRWKNLLLVCQGASISNLVIVGGSPAYRDQLRRLHREEGAGLALKLVKGSVSRGRRRAESDIRQADLVVLWGGTILDHSTSEQYRGTNCPLITLPHRGLTGMLDALADHLRKGG
ncbi:MAG: hypothetical protein VX498_06615 [Myxococcota bacterium]|nr:hypothetical protein [Myxococcota bacterium]